MGSVVTGSCAKCMLSFVLRDRTASQCGWTTVAVPPAMCQWFRLSASSPALVVVLFLFWPILAGVQWYLFHTGFWNVKKYFIMQCGCLRYLSGKTLAPPWARLGWIVHVPRAWGLFSCALAQTLRSNKGAVLCKIGPSMLDWPSIYTLRTPELVLPQDTTDPYLNLYSLQGIDTFDTRKNCRLFKHSFSSPKHGSLAFAFAWVP